MISSQRKNYTPQFRSSQIKDHKQQYMNNNLSLNKNNKPQYQSRCQDIQCFIIFIIFILAMAICSIINCNIQKLRLLNFPINSQEKTCVIDYPQTPYLYIVSQQQRLCISSCPKRQDQFLEYRCQPSSQSCPTHYKIFQDQYPNNQLGGICISQSKQIILMKNNQIKRKINNLLIIQKLKQIIIPITFSACILIPLLMKLIPRFFVYKKLIFTILLLILFLVASIFTFFSITQYGKAANEHLILTSTNNQIYKYWKEIFIALIGFLCILFLLRIIYTLLSSSKVLSFFTSLVDYANQNIINWKILTKMIILNIVFCLITAFMITICLIQYWLFVSKHSLEQIQQNQIYYQISSIGIFQGIVIFEGLWLIHFVYELYSFIVSCYIIDKIVQKQEQDKNALLCESVYIGLCYHIGSISKASLIKTIFIIPASILSLIRPNEGISIELTKGCHCLCGYILNASQNYRIIPYPIIKIYGLNYARGSLHTKYLYHINYNSRNFSFIQFIQFFQRLFLILALFIKTILICYFLISEVVVLYIVGILVGFYCLCLFSISSYIIISRTIQIWYLHARKINSYNQLQTLDKIFKQNQVLSQQMHYVNQQQNMQQDLN